MSQSIRHYLTLLQRASEYEIRARHYPVTSNLCAAYLREACHIRRRAARLVAA